MFDDIDTQECPAIKASRDFVHLFWNGETDACCQMLAPDFTWIGAQEEQYGYDPARFRETHEAIFDVMQRAILMQEEYEEVCHEGRLHMVSGQYLGYTAPELSLVFASRQRLTFVWREGETEGEEDERLELVHLHISNPLDAPRKGEPFPATYAEETRHYADLITLQKSYQHTCAIRDVDGDTHLVRLYEVCYLEAARQCTLVHMTTGTLRTRTGVSQVARDLMGEGGCGLVQVHRGYYVNALHVRTIGLDRVALTDGSTVPLSNRRGPEAREQLIQARLAPDAARE